MNLREFVNQNREENQKISTYADVVREERYFCAVLYHCMLSDREGMQRFLRLCGVKGNEDGRCGIQGVFVEYAMARDLWNCLGEDETKNEAKRNFLVAHAALPSDMKKLSVEEFNSKLVAGRISKKYIQSPARWGEENIRKMPGNTHLHALMLKWAFNVKPDIVIELDKDEVVCVEAKAESSEDSYGENEIRRSQREVQLYLMEQLLGYKKIYQVLLCLKEPRVTSATVTWEKAMEGFHTATDTCGTVQKASKRIRSMMGETG